MVPILRTQYYVALTNVQGRRYASIFTYPTRDQAFVFLTKVSQALLKGQDGADPTVSLKWEPIAPVYGSRAYQLEGGEDDLVALEREEEDRVGLY